MSFPVVKMELFMFGTLIMDNRYLNSFKYGRRVIEQWNGNFDSFQNLYDYKDSAYVFVKHEFSVSIQEKAQVNFKRVQILLCLCI